MIILILLSTLQHPPWLIHLDLHQQFDQILRKHLTFP